MLSSNTVVPKNHEKVTELVTDFLGTCPIEYYNRWLLFMFLGCLHNYKGEIGEETNNALIHTFDSLQQFLNNLKQTQNAKSS